MVKTAKFTVQENFFRKQRRENYKSKHSSPDSFKPITKLKSYDKLKKRSQSKTGCASIYLSIASCY